MTNYLHLACLSGLSRVVAPAILLFALLVHMGHVEPLRVSHRLEALIRMSQTTEAIELCSTTAKRNEALGLDGPNDGDWCSWAEPRIPIWGACPFTTQSCSSVKTRQIPMW
jgi:hypothetical protein